MIRTRFIDEMISAESIPARFDYSKVGGVFSARGAINREAIIATGEESAKADRRFAAWQRRHH